jgi:hypothetical protein
MKELAYYGTFFSESLMSGLDGFQVVAAAATSNLRNATDRLGSIQH